MVCPVRAEELASATELTPQEIERASYLYFDRCAGCHGVLRKGATGPALTVKETSENWPGHARRHQRQNPEKARGAPASPTIEPGRETAALIKGR
ncbi:MAG: c-type cytochrome [Armatimonadetes bacterium]|nr:c-type cytochrome [Armatimonadota bacterium]